MVHSRTLNFCVINNINSESIYRYSNDSSKSNYCCFFEKTFKICGKGYKKGVIKN